MLSTLNFLLLKIFHCKSICADVHYYTMREILIDLLRDELALAKRYPAQAALCIRDGWEFCRPEHAAGTYRRSVLYLIVCSAIAYIQLTVGSKTSQYGMYLLFLNSTSFFFRFALALIFYFNALCVLAYCLHVGLLACSFNLEVQTNLMQG